MAELNSTRDDDLHDRRSRILVRGSTILVTAIVAIACTEYAPGADSIFRGSDGSTGSMTHLGDDQAIYRDAHGTTGPILRPGGQESPTIITPQGEVMNGTVTPFGSPMPPNHITPAPVLPLNPRLGSAPASPAPPTIPSTPSNPAPFGGRR